MAFNPNHRLAYFDTGDGDRFPVEPRARIENLTDVLLSDAAVADSVVVGVDSADPRLPDDVIDATLPFYPVSTAAGLATALAAAGTAGGGTVAVSATATLSHAGITVPDFVTLVAPGKQSTVLQYTGSGTGITLGNQSSLRNVMVTRSGAAGSSIAVAFAANAARWVIADCVIEDHDINLDFSVGNWIGAVNDCIIQDAVTANVQYNHASNNLVTFRGGEIKGAPTGVLLVAGNAPRFYGVTIEDNDTYGIRQTGTVHNTVIDGCYFESNVTRDVSIESGGRAASIVDSFFVGGAETNVYLFGSDNARIEGNWFNPQGATPKSISIASAFATDTYIGPNYYNAAAFDPDVDDLGVGTRVVGYHHSSVPLPNPNNYAASVATHAFVATLPTKIMAVRICIGTTLAIDGANYWKMTLQRYNSAGVFQGEVCNLGSDTTAFTAAATQVVATLSATHRVLAAGDSLKLRWDKTGAPANLNFPSITMQLRELIT